MKSAGTYVFDGVSLKFSKVLPRVHAIENWERW